MSATKAATTGATAVAENGLVLIDGPAGMAATLTPDAAEATAHALLAAAAEARQHVGPASGDDQLA